MGQLERTPHEHAAMVGGRTVCPDEKSSLDKNKLSVVPNYPVIQAVEGLTNAVYADSEMEMINNRGTGGGLAHNHTLSTRETEAGTI